MVASPDIEVSRRLNGERVVVLGWSRAILMQLAHPLIAAGVAEHSAFRDGPLVAAARLRHTIKAMLSLTYGDGAARERTIERIRDIHRRVHGRLRETVGPFPAGTPYSAEDPDLLTWVHVTLMQSVPMIFDALVTPLPEADWDRFGIAARPTALALGATDHVPTLRVEVDRYVESMLTGGTLAVGQDARSLVSAVLRPPFAALTGPLARVNRTLTIGLLPAALREQYGFTWTDGDARALRRWTARVRWLRKHTPDSVWRWQLARQ